jgi:FkbM family methyltransferase
MNYKESDITSLRNLITRALLQKENQQIISILEQLLSDAPQKEILTSLLTDKNVLRSITAVNWREWWTIARAARILGDAELVDKACAIILSQNPRFAYARELPKHVRGYYAQTGQDKIIEEFFQNKPPLNKVFVEVGAFDGVHYSNVRRLYEYYAWTGLSIEPVKKNFRMLEKSYEDTPVRCLNFGVSDKEGATEINVVTWPDLPEWGSDVSTLDSAEMARWENYKPVWNMERIILKKLSTILDEQKIEAFDLLSVDTEGHDLEALQSLDFSRFKPALIVVEYGEKRSELIALLESKGYKFYLDNGQDIFVEKISEKK